MIWTTTPAPVFHLVDDEQVCLRVRGNEEVFRLRIWRTKGEPAVVLVSQVPGNVAPRQATDRLANAVKAAWLAHDPRGMVFFEMGQDGVTHSVSFVPFGLGDRSRLTKPKYHKVNPTFLPELVGGAIEL